MTLASGSRLGPYEILAPIGAGGMGEVYRARDTKLGRDVAIKVLLSEVSGDAERRLWFEQEARSASALNHPNIITVYDIDSSDSNLYLAMELVEGRTLREMLSAEPLPTKKMLDTAVQVADGLAKAHAAGIVHRDLKPENLMISKDGFVKILDFGLAGTTKPPTAETSFQRLTFRRGSVLSARFAPDGQTVVYGAAWEGNPVEVFATRPESPVSRTLGLPPADILSVSSGGELAISLGRRYLAAGWESTGTLAQLPLDGGAPREVLEDVQEADWAPDGKSLAVVRRVGDSRRLEFPIGKVLYQTAGWISHPRVSPDAKLVAFNDHPLRGDNEGRLMVVDTSGKNRLTGPPAGTGLAWSPRGDEIWFTGPDKPLQAVTLSGKTRAVANFPGEVTLQDIARDGRVLFNRINWRREIVGLATGESRERNLTWLDWSFPTDLSDDGKSLLFVEQREGARGGYSSYLRKTDGSPAVLLGQALAWGLSPDGKWALTTGGVGSQQVTLLPTGPGQPKPLPKADITYQWGNWFPDGRRILIMGSEPGRGLRLYVQDVAGGKPRAITPEGVSFFTQGITPDGKSVAARSPEQRILLYPIEPGEPQSVPGISPDDLPIQWTADGRSLYVLGSRDLPARIYIVDVSSGRRTLWKDLTPPDPAGVLTIGPIFLTPDGKSYVYSYRRTLEDLYLAEGLR